MVSCRSPRLQKRFDRAQDKLERGTLAGIPCCQRLTAHLDRRARESEFMVAIDPYINETTRHAHIILPPTHTRTWTLHLASICSPSANTAKFRTYCWNRVRISVTIGRLSGVANPQGAERLRLAVVSEV